MDKQNNIPKLRFFEFSDGWEAKNLGEITTWASGGTPSKEVPHYWNGQIPWISASSMRGTQYFDSPTKITEEGLKSGSKLAKKGTLLILVRGSMLFNTIPIGLTMRDLSFNQDVKSISVNEVTTSLFILYWFISNESKVLNMVTGTGIGAGKLDLPDLKSLNISLPTLPEQQKISTFLSTVDEKLQALKKKKSLLEIYKKGIMQKLFSQEIRFKDEEGNDFEDWEVKTLGEISFKVAGNNLSIDEINGLDVLTISSEFGFLRQQEKYNQIIAGNSLESYTLLKKGEMSYNRGASKRYKYGCFYDLKDYESALVPNVYISFKFNTDNNPIFYRNLFSTGYANKQLRGMISSSTRLDGLLNINKEEFYSLEIAVPSFEEQNKIANFLTAIDEKINKVDTQIKQTELWKKGLLQQMFV